MKIIKNNLNWKVSYLLRFLLTINKILLFFWEISSFSGSHNILINFNLEPLNIILQKTKMSVSVSDATFLTLSGGWNGLLWFYKKTKNNSYWSIRLYNCSIAHIFLQPWKYFLPIYSLIGIRHALSAPLQLFWRQQLAISKQDLIISRLWNLLVLDESA